MMINKNQDLSIDDIVFKTHYSDNTYNLSNHNDNDNDININFI